MNKEFLVRCVHDRRENGTSRAAAAAARNQYGIKTHTIKIGDTRRRNKNTRSKRLWCFVSHRLWQHKIQRNNISTVKFLLFFRFIRLAAQEPLHRLCVYIRKKMYTKEKNHSNRKAVEEHAKIACRFWYYKCMFGSYFRRSFLVFDLAFFSFIFRFWDRFISRIFSVV